MKSAITRLAMPTLSFLLFAAAKPVAAAQPAAAKTPAQRVELYLAARQRHALAADPARIPQQSEIAPRAGRGDAA